MSEPVWGVLTRAADRLEQLAAAVPDRHIYVLTYERKAREWAAAMSPVVAAPLVEWLRDAARRCEAQPEWDPSGFTARRTAVEFARRVLGEEGP